MPNLKKQFTSWTRTPWVRALRTAHPKAEIYLVGGAVRDALLGRIYKDTDVVIRNVSKVALERHLAQYGKVNLVGKRFGVFKFKPRGWTGGEIDIALPRTEHTINQTGAYRDFTIASNAKLKIEDDLSRRDFTINAMAWNLLTNELVDPFGGQVDLAKKIIRTVGEPKLRFAEDYSRMLRALRFSIQLNFTLAPTTKAAIKLHAKQINRAVGAKRIVPYEVIAAELQKMMRVDPVNTVQTLDAFGFIDLLMPDLSAMKRCPQPAAYHREGDVWKHTLLALGLIESKQFKKEFAESAPTDLAWALLFHDVGKPPTLRRADRLRFNGHDVASAKIWRQTAERCTLASAGIDVDGIEAVIAKHMLLASADVPNMKQTTLEKYFFNPLFPGKLFLMVMFCDVSASIHANGKPNFTHYRQLTRRLGKLRAAGHGTTLGAPLITGTDLQRNFGLAEGPRIGQLLITAREAQLRGKITTKADALKFIKKQL
jgi:tRNA nucleotidyltransferase/poly(A) polymerase